MCACVCVHTSPNSGTLNLNLAYLGRGCAAMSVLISVLFSFISSLALGALVYPYVDRYTDHRFSREIEKPAVTL